MMQYNHLIEEYYPKFTKSEQKVANYLLQVGKKIIHQTMQDIKTHTKVGDATIIRFSQKLGFSGFTDLKIAIAKEYFNKKNITITESNLYTTLLETLIEILKATYALLNREALEIILSRLNQARHIYIFGVSSSGNTCMQLENMLLRVGLKAKAVVDPHVQAHLASLMNEEDILIVISLSGRTKDSYDSLVIAHQNGAYTVAITSHLQSPIAKLANQTLLTAIDEFLDGGSLAGKISQLYICEIIVLGYEQKHNIDVLELREKVLRSILTKSLLH